MESKNVKEVFNSTAIREVESEILMMQHEIERKRYNYEVGEEVIECLLGTR